MGEVRAFKLSTPLGDKKLLFYRMAAVEALSEIPVFQLQCLSDDPAIDPDAILAKNIGISLTLPDDTPRDFAGFVTRFAQAGMRGRFHVYHATVHPWLWFLTRRTNCRIFQNISVPQIVKAIFADHPSADIEERLTGKYPERKYCVQYRESDFTFVSRLLEEDGIYYYFSYKGKKNTLVLADSLSAHDPFPGYANIPFIAPRSEGRSELEHIAEWEFQREVQPGRFVLTDYDFQKPAVALEASALMPRSHDFAKYEAFDYPGEYYEKDEGKSYAETRRDEAHSGFEVVSGAGSARGMATGCLFKLTGFPRKDQNKEYLLTHTELECQSEGYESDALQGTTFDCRFRALTTEQQFRPARRTPRPIVKGLQTAVVTGPAGEEIYTDKYGRVKVQFHWDRYGKLNEESSCWIRVSHPWAGKNFGMVAIPRIGQEVVIEFVEGDPDRPLITGRVYNAAEMPPWELPGNKTQTGVLTRSSLGGSPANANAIRFEDKKGNEQLWIHAEKNQDIEVENDETHWVGHDRTKTIDHDETTHVKHDRTETVDNNETITIHGHRTEVVDKDEKITIHQNRTETVDKNETITIHGARTESVDKDEKIAIGGGRTENVAKDETITISGGRTESVARNESISIGGARTESVDKDEDVTIGGARSVSVAKDESLGVQGQRMAKIAKDDNLSVGKNLVIDAGESITIKTGSASITLKKDGTISIKGKDISIKGSGKISVKASSDVVIKGSKVGIN